MVSESTRLKWIRDDHRRRVDAIEMEASTRRSCADIARTGAVGLSDKFPDDVSAFDKALAVVEALDAAGIVFATISSCGTTDD